MELQHNTRATGDFVGQESCHSSFLILSIEFKTSVLLVFFTIDQSSTCLWLASLNLLRFFSCTGGAAGALKPKNDYFDCISNREQNILWEMRTLWAAKISLYFISLQFQHNIKTNTYICVTSIFTLSGLKLLPHSKILLLLFLNFELATNSQRNTYTACWLGEALHLDQWNRSAHHSPVAEAAMRMQSPSKPKRVTCLFILQIVVQ